MRSSKLPSTVIRNRADGSNNIYDQENGHLQSRIRTPWEDFFQICIRTIFLLTFDDSRGLQSIFMLWPCADPAGGGGEEGVRAP